MKTPKDGLSRAVFVAAGIVAILAGGLVIGRSVASAQEGAAAPAAAGPPKLTITRRVYDTKALLATPALPDNVYRGRTTWLQRCAYCHDGVGQPTYKTLGPWIGAETVETYTEDGVRAFVGTGTERMPGFRYTLNVQQMNDLIAFLKTVPASTKPTEDQLAGRLPGARAAAGEGGGNSD